MSRLPVSIIPCLDMREGRVVKGVHFADIRDAGDPVACALAYCQAGADALTLLDITATTEGRGTLLDVVRQVAEVVSVPFTVGGGIRDARSAEAVLDAGADSVSTSSAAFRKPEVIAEMVRELGAERLVVAVDVDHNPALPSGYEVFIDGGTTATGFDALEWVKRIDGYGVRRMLSTSKATDGTRDGYDLSLIKMIVDHTGAQVIASGGAGAPLHFKEAADAGAWGVLAASVFHFGVIAIPALKQYLRDNGIRVLP